MTQGDPPAWRAFQDRIADLFRGAAGWDAWVDYDLRGARGNVCVDVFAEFRVPYASRLHRVLGGHRLVFKVVVECKCWNRPVSQSELYALKAVVEDVGASLGIIVSTRGFQRGARAYVDGPINVLAVTFDELDYMIRGGETIARCFECGAVTFLPLPPQGSALVYCRDCYMKKKPRY